jgi:hypothetical protein
LPARAGLHGSVYTNDTRGSPKSTAERRSLQWRSRSTLELKELKELDEFLLARAMEHLSDAAVPAGV